MRLYCTSRRSGRRSNCGWRLVKRECQSCSSFRRHLWSTERCTARSAYFLTYHSYASLKFRGEPGSEDLFDNFLINNATFLKQRVKEYDNFFLPDGYGQSSSELEWLNTCFVLIAFIVFHPSENCYTQYKKNITLTVISFIAHRVR